MTRSGKSSVLAVKNRFDFTDMARFDVEWEAVRAGRVVASGNLGDASLAPGETAEFNLGPGAEGCEINIRFSLKEDTLWAPAGHVVALYQAL